MQTEFDYIVVGGGTAGCVLANRLSADPKTSVCLIEAGGTNKNMLINMPMGSGSTVYMPKFSWQMHSSPEPYSNNRSYYHPRGNVLGGSSCINGMIYIRGQQQDFNDWAAGGATGWDWQNVLPYFKLSEDQCRGADDWHGVGGPLHVSDAIVHYPTEDRLIAAANAIGIPTNNDFNGASQTGVGRFQASIKNGRRVSGATAYLEPIRSRKNLTILTGARTLSVEFKDKVAEGIVIRLGQRDMKLHAGREVILSAGAFQSPQLLKLSGVGPAAELREHGIGVVSDRAQVGENLHDHIGAPMSWKMKSADASLNQRLRPPRLFSEVLKYFFSKRGVMAMPSASVGLFTDSTGQGGRPDLQYHCLPLSGDLDAELEKGKADLSKFPGLTLMPYQLRPKSRGNITLQSADPIAMPKIIMNYFAEPEDLEVLVRGMKIAQRIVESEPLSELIDSRVYPEQERDSLEDFKEFARAYGHTGYHPVGTCRMGSDSESVVDCDLNVRGVERLRVVDASVMPVVVSGNTNSATVMIAEKISKVILADHAKR